MIAALLLASASQQVHLKYEPPGRPAKVTVVGDFNHWDAPGMKVKPSGDGLSWVVDLDLEPGAYRYVWIENGQTVPTGEAFKKAVQMLVITPADYAKFPGVQGDGIITASALRHFPDARDTKRLKDRTFQLSFRTRHDDVQSVAVSVTQPGSETKVYPMALASSDPVYDLYQVKVVVDPDRLFQYRFLLNDGRGSRAFDTRGLSPGTIGAGDPFSQDPRSYKAP